MKVVKITMNQDGFPVLFAKQLSNEAAGYQYEIRIIWEAKNIISDAKSILGLMALEVKKGTSLTLTFNGADEDHAIELSRLFE